MMAAPNSTRSAVERKLWLSGSVLGFRSLRRSARVLKLSNPAIRRHRELDISQQAEGEGKGTTRLTRALERVDRLVRVPDGSDRFGVLDQRSGRRNDVSEASKEVGRVEPTSGSRIERRLCPARRRRTRSAVERARAVKSQLTCSSSTSRYWIIPADLGLFFSS